MKALFFWFATVFYHFFKDYSLFLGLVGWKCGMSSGKLQTREQNPPKLLIQNTQNIFYHDSLQLSLRFLHYLSRRQGATNQNSNCFARRD